MSGNFKKDDLRIIKTQRSLLAAISFLLQKQKFRQITVNDLCAEALISRAAFYTHYKDKYDLLRSWFQESVKTEYSNGDIEKFVSEIIFSQSKSLANILNDADSETILLVQEFLFSAIGALFKWPNAQNDMPEYIMLQNLCAGGMFQVLLWQNRNKFPTYIKPAKKYVLDLLYCVVDWNNKYTQK